jgi:hypothetical protein
LWPYPKVRKNGNAADFSAHISGENHWGLITKALSKKQPKDRMWMKDYRGGAVNLDKLARVTAYEGAGRISVLAYYDGGKDYVFLFDGSTADGNLFIEKLGEFEINLSKQPFPQPA